MGEEGVDEVMHSLWMRSASHLRSPRRCRGLQPPRERGHRKARQRGPCREGTTSGGEGRRWRSPFFDRSRGWGLGTVRDITAVACERTPLSYAPCPSPAKRMAHPPSSSGAPRPPEEAWAIARLHKRRSAQSAARESARQWPTRPWVPPPLPMSSEQRGSSETTVGTGVFIGHAVRCLID